MKSHKTFLFLVLALMLATLTASAQQPVGYLIEQTDPEAKGISFHLAHPLSDKPIQDVDTRKPIPEGLPQLLQQVAKVPGVQQAFLMKYQLVVVKLPPANWGNIAPAVKQLIKKQVGADLVIIPPVADCHASNQQTSGQVSYATNCPPNNPNSLQAGFNINLLPNHKFQLFDANFGNSQAELSELVDRCGRIEGVERVFLQDNRLDVDKGDTYGWTTIEPQILEIVADVIGKMKVEDKDKVAFPLWPQQPARTWATQTAIPGLAGEAWIFDRPSLVFRKGLYFNPASPKR